MIDKIVLVDSRTAVITYTDRRSLTLYSDYDIRDFVKWYLEDKKLNAFDEHRRAMVASTEDTTEIKIA